MVNLLVKHKDKTLVDKFPMDIHDLYQKLHGIGIRWSPSQVKLTDDENSGIEVKLYSDNDFGNHVSMLMKETDTLEDIQTVVGAISNAPDNVKEALEEYVLHDQLRDKEDLFRVLTELKHANAPIVTTFYCPLTAQLHDNEYGEMDDVYGDYINQCADDIAEAVAKDQSPDFEMADYITDHPTANAKLMMATWSVEMIKGTLYGRIDCRSAEAFTPEEIEALKDGISGQNSDGFGEGFEQRPIKSDDGDLYVSFWHSGDDYFIYTQDEMDEYINQGQGLKMGGM